MAQASGGEGLRDGVRAMAREVSPRKLEPKLEEAERIASDASEATLTTIKSTAHKLEKLVATL